MLVIVLVTKFTHGAWIVVIAMPLVFLLMTGIRRHYDRVAAELRPEPAGHAAAQPRSTPSCSSPRLHTPDAAGAGVRPGHPAQTR